MRAALAAFSLLGMVVTLGIVIWLYGTYFQSSETSGSKEVQEALREAPSGRPAAEPGGSFTPAPSRPAPGKPLLVDVLQRAKAVRTQSDLTVIRQSIQVYEAENGRFPASLEEMRKRIQIPPAPEGFRYEYDPATGEIDLAPK